MLFMLGTLLFGYYITTAEPLILLAAVVAISADGIKDAIKKHK